jgi:hypothetical protein
VLRAFGLARGREEGSSEQQNERDCGFHGVQSLTSFTKPNLARGLERAYILCGSRKTGQEESWVARFRLPMCSTRVHRAVRKCD